MQLTPSYLYANNLYGILSYRWLGESKRFEAAVILIFRIPAPQLTDGAPKLFIIGLEINSGSVTISTVV